MGLEVSDVQGQSTLYKLQLLQSIQATFHQSFLAPSEGATQATRQLWSSEASLRPQHSTCPGTRLHPRCGAAFTFPALLGSCLAHGSLCTGRLSCRSWRRCQITKPEKGLPATTAFPSPPQTPGWWCTRSSR